MKSMSPRVAMVVMMAMLTACASSSVTPNATATSSAAPATIRATDGQQSVTMMLDWTPNTNHAGLFIAQANGWYTDAGLDVTIIQPGEQGALSAVATGAADFGVSVSEELLPARTQGVPVVSIAAILASNTSAFLSLDTDNITAPADFAGNRYGGFGGQLETALVEQLVECGGGSADQVDFVEVGNVDYRVGLERDFYDFVWIFEGWDGIRLQDAGVNTIPLADHFDCIPDWYTPVLVTNEALIAQDPELVSRFVAATARGYDVATTDPDAAAAALLEGAPELDKDLVKASADYLADKYATEGEEWGHQTQQVWQRFSEFLTKSGLITTPVNVDDAFTNTFLPG